MSDPCEWGCSYGEIRCNDCGSLRMKHSIKFQLYLAGRIAKEPWMDEIIKELEAEIDAGVPT